MPLDNAKHERFAQGLAKGMPAIKAYEAAGYKPNDGHSSRLAGNGRIRARVAEIQAAGAQRAAVTVESISDELANAARLAIEWKAPSALVSAIMGKAKVCGLIVDKIAATIRSIENMSNDELDAIIAGTHAEKSAGSSHTAH